MVVVLGILGAAVGVSLPASLPETRAELNVAAPKTAGIRENASRSVPASKRMTQKQMPRPVWIDIPAIDVSAPVIPLGLNPDGTLEVPVDFGDTGWFTMGPEPGEPGAAVIAGHLDSRSGPGVFYRLRELRVGGMIRIRLQDRSTVRYVVDSMIRVPKNRFPTNRVYARTKQPTLRLITCAGELNRSTGHHPDNYIVFASIVR
jgi:LPXTG-site transpeptidase (sortase) family protein